MLLPAASGWAAESLTVTFTTSNPGGSYGNRNVHAVWLEDSQGNFVTTLGNAGRRTIWGNTRAHDIHTWYTSNDDAASDIIARTGATETSYKTYTLNWDFTDRDGNVIPDGAYTLQFELTNDNWEQNHFHRASFSINKNGVSSSQGPITQNGYSNVVIEYQVTQNTAPVVSNTAASNIQFNSAQVGGQVLDTGGQTPQVLLYWGATDGGTNATAWENVIDIGTAAGPFTTPLTNLAPEETYYFRCYAENSVGSDWADSTETFTTPADPMAGWVRIIAAGDLWRYREGTTYPGEGWNDLGFDAQDWLIGGTGIGYGDGDDQTELGNMRYNYYTVYMRYSFILSPGTAVTDMLMAVDYDDGFVAYLNGNEVARRGVPEGQDHETTAALHDAVVDGGTVEEIDLTPYVSYAQPGENIFAIEVHNAALDSSDLTMIPEVFIQSTTVSASLELAPAVLTFGVQDVGSAVSDSFTLSNPGTGPVQIQSIQITGVDKNVYVLASPPAVPFQIAGGQSQTISVAFSPLYGQSYDHAQLAVASNDPDRPLITGRMEGQGAQSDPMPLYVRDSMGGPCNALLKDGDILWAGCGASLYQFDCSDLAQIEEVMHLRLSGVIEDLAVSGTVLFAAMGDAGMAVIDFDDPSKIITTLIDDNSVFANAVAVSGNTLYLADGPGGFHVFDITVANSPSLVTTVATSGAAVDVSLTDHTALVLDTSAGLLLFDVTDPANLVPAATYTEIPFGNALAVQDSTAYVSDSTGQLSLLDISDPQSPTALGHIYLSAPGNALTIQGSSVIAATEDVGFDVINVSDPQQPALLAAATTPGQVGDVLSGDSVLFVADGTAGLRILQLDSLYNVISEGTHDVSGSPLALDAIRSTVVASDLLDHSSDILGMDWSGALQLLSQTQPSGQGQDVVLVDQTAFVANGSSGLSIFDLSAPDAPSLQGNVPTDGPALGVALKGSHAYIATGRGVQSVDISTSASPSIIDSWNSAGWASGAAVTGNSLLVANGGKGLAVLDISNPAALSPVATLPTKGIAYAVSIAGSTALVADGPAGLTLVDVTDPVAPAIQSSVALPGMTVDVAVSGTYACLANTILGVQIVDLSAPGAPSLIAASRTPVRAVSVVTSGSRVLVADSRGGLVILGDGPQPVLVGPDLTADGIVNLADFAILTENWLNEGSLFASLAGDLNGDGWTDIYDLIILNDAWLQTTADVRPPVPNPATWDQPPAATGTTSIAMSATAAADESGVEYYFACVAGDGHDSGWQDSPTYTDTNLTPETEYSYRVRIRDKSPAQNATEWSSTESAQTDEEIIVDEIITVLRAEFEEDELSVRARSSRQPDVALTVVGYGQMQWNDYRERYEFEAEHAAYPGQTITIRSSLGTEVTTRVEFDD